MVKIYFKNPLNFVGGKYKILPQIIPLFPKDIDTFVDLFGGGFNVGINIDCNKIIYNDSCEQVTDLLEHFYIHSSDYIHKKIVNRTKQYSLSRYEIIKNEDKYKEKYIELRNDYNNNPTWDVFYTLITCAFSNQIRFNSEGKFNMPYGKRDYNTSLQEKLKSFIDKMHEKNIEFCCKDFRDCKFDKDAFVYCDPPYYNSVATYNENGGWSKQDEIDLLNYLEELNKQEVKFALPNNLKYDNPMIKKWMNKYNIHYLNSDYSNCNYQKKDKSKDIEILITNY